MPAYLVPDEISLLCLQIATLLYPHIVKTQLDGVSSSYKDTNSIIETPPLITLPKPISGPHASLPYIITLGVQFSSLVQSCPTPCIYMGHSTPGLPVHHQLQEYTQSIESALPSNHLILCCRLLLLPSIFSSNRIFWNESVLRIRWPNYWSFSFNISPSNEHSGLISFRMDWLGLLAVQGTLRSILQHHSLKASILWCSDFFIVQLSHPYMTTGKTIALTIWTFVSKVMSLLFNMLSRLELPCYGVSVF